MTSTLSEFLPMLTEQFEKAANLIAKADALIITAGAGMGVDSGLPDFRGGKGFWGAYPALGRAGLSFEEIANPRAFIDTPDLAWGFYGHRFNLYRETVPNNGFKLLKDIAERLTLGYFVFTSNVDGQFQKANFDQTRIIECHGSIHHLQCLDGCEDSIWTTAYFKPEIDTAECKISNGMPTCPHCHGIARPNILMFDDWNWLAHRKYEQQLRYRMWRNQVSHPVVIEIGAGTAIPSVRSFGKEQRCPMIRINPRDAEVDQAEDVSLPCGGLEGIEAISEALAASGFLMRRILEIDEIDDVEF